jgi:hypothetical protein
MAVKHIYINTTPPTPPPPQHQNRHRHCHNNNRPHHHQPHIALWDRIFFSSVSYVRLQHSK